MIKIATFRNDQAQEANAFLESHPCRNENGIFFNQYGIFITYEDGEIMGKAESVASLQGLVRQIKSERVNKEPEYRWLGRRIGELKTEMRAMSLHADNISDSYKDGKKADDALKTLQNELQMTQGKYDIAKWEINRLESNLAATEGVIADIENGNFKI